MNSLESFETKHDEMCVPVGYLDDESGKKLLVRLETDNEYAILIPPAYSTQDAMRGGEWFKDSAFAKHGFILFDGVQEAVSIARIKDGA